MKTKLLKILSPLMLLPLIGLSSCVDGSKSDGSVKGMDKLLSKNIELSIRNQFCGETITLDSYTKEEQKDMKKISVYETRMDKNTNMLVAAVLGDNTVSNKNYFFFQDKPIDRLTTIGMYLSLGVENYKDERKSIYDSGMIDHLCVKKDYKIDVTFNKKRKYTNANISFKDATITWTNNGKKVNMFLTGRFFRRPSTESLRWGFTSKIKIDDANPLKLTRVPFGETADLKNLIAAPIHSAVTKSDVDVYMNLITDFAKYKTGKEVPTTSTIPSIQKTLNFINVLITANTFKDIKFGGYKKMTPIVRYKNHDYFVHLNMLKKEVDSKTTQYTFSQLNHQVDEIYKKDPHAYRDCEAYPNCEISG